MAVTRQDLLEALSRNRPSSWLVDEMTHTGGAGISSIERWSIGPTSEGPWVWRVMWIPRRLRGWQGRRQCPERLAFGVAETQEEAQAEGRREARRLAKLRRQAA